jgi:hypothetical protein
MELPIDTFLEKTVFLFDNYSGNGGDILTMQTAATPNDFAYNREFQRMRFIK